MDVQQAQALAAALIDQATAERYLLANDPRAQVPLEQQPQARIDLLLRNAQMWADARERIDPILGSQAGV
jgi:hypothetical protein